MDWKVFFKPDKRKIIAFLAIPVIMLTGVIVMGNMDSKSPIGLALGTLFSIILFIGFFSVGIFSTIFKALGMDSFPDVSTGSAIEPINSSISLLSVIPWWYVLSCTIIFTLDKLKSRK